MWSSLEGLVIGGRYEIGAHIATGGMAVVFKGWDHRVERPVAIKVLRQLEQADAPAVCRFQREAHAVAMLNQPNVVRAYDFFEEHGCAYLIMEYVEGPNLKQQLRRYGPLPQGDALRIAEQVCAALEAAHAHSFIHRDIKPQNILLDPSGIIKVADFGIVHITRGTTLTSDGTVLGTADYIAPEQARGETLTAATDVYALGVVLYEMLTGKLPFSGSSPMAVATLHATEPVPPPSRVVPSISPYVEAVVLRALHKHPARRYQSAAAFALALRLARETVCAAREDDRQPVRSQQSSGSGPTIAHQPAARDVVPALAGMAGGRGGGAACAHAAAVSVGLNSAVDGIEPPQPAAGLARAVDPARVASPRMEPSDEPAMPDEPSESWRDVAAVLLRNASGASGDAANGAAVREAMSNELGREVVSVAGVVATEPDVHASWPRLLLVALTSLALLGGTVGLELWLNLHAAGIGILPLP